MRHGYLLWLTGYSGAGKSTIASLLKDVLKARGEHSVCWLDGDVVRSGLCRDLGFSAEDRHENIRRVGEVARMLVESGLIVIASFISPFERDRMWLRSLLPAGRFIEIFVDTPLEVARQRDPKALYRKVNTGEIRNFTGVDSPYEAPRNPEIRLRTLDTSPEQLVTQILVYLGKKLSDPVCTTEVSGAPIC